MITDLFETQYAFFVFLWESLCLAGSKEGEECTIKSICNQVGLDAEKAMAPHSSTLAWKIPWTEERGRLQSIGSHRVGHNLSDLAAAAT